MKRLFTSVLLFTGIFCLTSCSSPMGGSSVRENKLGCAFTSSVSVSLDKLSAEGTMTRLGDGEWTAEFDSPNTLSGVKLTFSSGSVTADYKGLNFSVPKSALPMKSMLCNLIEAVDKNARESELRGRESEGHFEINGTLDGGDYTLMLDNAGNIASFDMPNNLLHISFTDVRVRSDVIPPAAEAATSAAGDTSEQTTAVTDG
ncbi:hypothetical protein SAMN02910353_01573 [Ruminococcus sp. YRD2003]|uniref:hypothetical protein n=1 Tax=Ruminococcus sp. YRD2003 TaxID=1452313 RepID=UPI0008D71932|nr:hypothetical protein SAMN02910353_01573 [Ruminococcus flavefaciens]